MKFVKHINLSNAEKKYMNISSIISNIPLHYLVQKPFNEAIHNIGIQHETFFGTK
jgi:hypothetical protein